MAYQNNPTWAELAPPYLAMLVNVVEALEPVSKNIQHVSFMQGYKVYGAHLGPFKGPPGKQMQGTRLPNLTLTSNSFWKKGKLVKVGPGRLFAPR